MKKFMFLILMLPVFVFAEDCDTLTQKVNLTGTEVSCDSSTTGQISALFLDKNDNNTYYPAGFGKDSESGYQNKVCYIECNETYNLMFNPVVKVLAGTGFNYPIYVTGVRTCKATYYNIDTYEKNMINWTLDYNKNKSNIESWYKDKVRCDNFLDTSDNKIGYSLSGTISAYFEGVSLDNTAYKGDSSDSITITDKDGKSHVALTYEFNEDIDTGLSKDAGKGSYGTIVSKRKLLTSCNYNETSHDCDGDVTTISEWEQKTTSFGEFTLKKSYVEKFTGNILKEETKTSDGSDKAYCPRDVVYTDFTAVTNNSEDEQYDIVLQVDLFSKDNSKQFKNKSAANTSVVGTSSSYMYEFNINCGYKVSNLIFPTEDDDNYQLYGSTAFQYRIIDTSDPFPGRDAKANYIGHEDVAKVSTSVERWLVSLSKSNWKTTDVSNYGVFSDSYYNCENSSFLDSLGGVTDNRTTNYCKKG